MSIVCYLHGIFLKSFGALTPVLTNVSFSIVHHQNIIIQKFGKRFVVFSSWHSHSAWWLYKCILLQTWNVQILQQTQPRAFKDSVRKTRSISKTVCNHILNHFRYQKNHWIRIVCLIVCGCFMVLATVPFSTQRVRISLPCALIWLPTYMRTCRCIVSRPSLRLVLRMKP